MKGTLEVEIAGNDQLIVSSTVTVYCAAGALGLRVTFRDRRTIHKTALTLENILKKAVQIEAYGAIDIEETWQMWGTVTKKIPLENIKWSDLMSLKKLTFDSRKIVNQYKSKSLMGKPKLKKYRTSNEKHEDPFKYRKRFYGK